MMPVYLPEGTSALVASVLAVGANLQQTSGWPWWVWLVGLSVLLLFLFITILALAWRDTKRPDGEG
jgi:hypothetical protein